MAESVHDVATSGNRTERHGAAWGTARLSGSVGAWASLRTARAVALADTGW
ncbi:hypothetical protein [Haloactinopolyspora alba]|uniref:hypothetical protein n=1 Tax=Haloactinopolyspora alba TaxID=648780 RepID=UPI0013EA2010|nr:hypothetical protein [Haloactinopolyspora alba]